MKRPTMPKLPPFTREAKTVAATVAALVLMALLVAIVVPQFGIYAARCGGEATIIEARAEAYADQIRAMGLYRADTSCVNGAALLLDLKAIEGASR